MPPTLLNAIHQPTATVHVVLPAYIGFTVMPGRKWVLESGRKYEITIELYDQDSHKMHLSRVSFISSPQAHCGPGFPSMCKGKLVV